MKNKEIYKRILKLIKPQLPLIIFSLLMAVVSVVSTLYIPILTGNAVDLMFGPGKVDLAGIKNVLLIFLITLLAGGIANFLMTLSNNRVTFKIVRDVRLEMLGKIHSVPVSTLDRMGHGDILSRTVSDVERLSDGLLLGFSQLFTGVLTIIGTLAFMFATNGLISIVVVLLTPLSLFAASFISKKTYTHFQAQAKLQGQMTGYINESVNAIKLVKAFGAEDSKAEGFNELNEAYAKTNLKALFFSSITNPVTRFVNGLVYASVGIFGALLAGGVGSKITIGTLSCFLSYANQYTKPFNEISGVITEFQNAVACAGRIFEFLDTEDSMDIKDGCEAVESPKLTGEIEIKDLAFSYDKTKRLLYDINFKVPKGHHIAIVGPTGCGKTTFINLLMRFFEPDNGEILFDGISSDVIHKKYLRSNIGMVLQETWLKSATVAENIAYGHKEATREQIIEAAKKAHAHSFIMRLENGYDTVLSQDGGNLSAGQKQLLCIARVMLNIPPVLILDEATSSIDTRTEIKITKAFATLMEGRTSFIVAHRLSTIRNADLILVMKDGNIIEQGNHEELLEKKGFYYQMLNA
ncbi:MAG: ABC transporter ATP-binding protein/permease [Lachnospiraceae bacterium]|nr:ABC transporter ATP-binding protein/permease [Lachnospiraceae bacterium]